LRLMLAAIFVIVAVEILDLAPPPFRIMRIVKAGAALLAKDRGVARAAARAVALRSVVAAEAARERRGHRVGAVGAGRARIDPIEPTAALIVAALAGPLAVPAPALLVAPAGAEAAAAERSGPAIVIAPPAHPLLLLPAPLVRLAPPLGLVVAEPGADLVARPIDEAAVVTAAI